MYNNLLNVGICFLLYFSLNDKLNSRAIKVNLIMFIIPLEMGVAGLTIVLSHLLGLNDYVTVMFPALVVFFFVVFGFAKQIRLLAIKYEKMSAFVVISESIIIVFGLVNSYFAKFIEDEYEHMLFFSLAYMTILFLSYNYLNNYYVLLMKQKLAVNRENLEKDIVPIITNIRKLQHEYSHILAGFAYNLKAEDRVLPEFNMERNTDISVPGSKMVENLLNVKKNQLNVKGINLDIDICDDFNIKFLSIKEYELVMVLANLIDNGSDAIMDYVKIQEAKKLKEIGETKIGEEKIREGKKYIVKDIDNRSNVKLVKVNIEQYGGYTRIRVSNSHSNVKGHAIEKMFEEGYSSKDGHYGLGLTIVGELVSSNNGFINAYSDGEDHVFEIELHKRRDN